MTKMAWTKEEFKNKIMTLESRYHIHHPFHIAMNSGQCNKQQIQGWILNRFYYQINIPRKDAALLANCPDQTIRRQWLQRIIDHDGQKNNEGGIAAWIQLGEACDLSRTEIISLKHVLPGVRFAVDAYVRFAQQRPWQETVCASLTELFAPKIHTERLKNWPTYYPWININGLQYFRTRLNEAPRDVAYGLSLTLNYFRTRTEQEQALEIIQFKLDILWSMLDAMQMVYGLNNGIN